MHPEFLYQINQIVFAETVGYTAYPARVAQFNKENGLYKINFIGYKCSSSVLANMMEKFNPQNIQKYEDFYSKHPDPKKRIILKKIEKAKIQYHKSFIKGRKGRNSNKNNKKSKNKVEKVISLISEQNQQECQEQMPQIISKNTSDPIDMQEQIQIQEKDKVQISDKISKQLYQIKQIDFYSNDQQKLKIKLKQISDKSKSKHLQQIHQTLSQLSPIHQNQSRSRQASALFLQNANAVEQQKAEIRQQINIIPADDVSQSNSPQLISPQSSSPSAGIQIILFQNSQKKPTNTQIQTIEKIRQQPQITRDSISNLHPLFDDNGQKIQHFIEQSSMEEDSIKEINICEDVDMYDINCAIDQLQQEQNDFKAMLYSMNYRKQRLSVLSPEEIICHLTKIIDVMLKQLERAKRSGNIRMIIMKKKQYLVVILSLQGLNLTQYIKHNCVIEMIDFVTKLSACQPKIRRMFTVQNFSIRSKLNILYLHFKKATISELSIALESYDQISLKFQQYKELKFTIDF